VTEIDQVSADTGVEIEAFCHGALCVSYSGQCYSSEAWGGRSANRGQCAQACRMPYGLIVDGQIKVCRGFCAVSVWRLWEVIALFKMVLLTLWERLVVCQLQRAVLQR
jgi:collagenase-like PrtC family protease